MGSTPYLPHLPADLLAAEASAPPAFLGPTAALVVTAAVIGYLSVRVRVVPIVGFLLAGVLIGPHQLGVVQRQEVVEAAAEVGVILLLFTIGIEFSLARLARIRRWILLGGGLQVGLTTGLTLAVLLAMGVGWREGLFTGFLLALSSTAIVLKLLGDSGETASTRGQLALALLIFQDLAVVLMVLVVPLLGAGSGSGSGEGAGSSSPADLARALVTAAAIIAVVLVLARRVMPPLLERVARTCSPEVFLLAVVAICFGTAYLTARAGVSVSLGAFLAGLVVSESRHSAHAFGEVLPLQILFSAVFFVSVGMLLDLGYVLDNLPLVLGGVLLVLVVKVVATVAGTLALRVGFGTALGSGLLLAQVGEFSFVLEVVGRSAGLSPFGLGSEGSQAFIAATVLLMVATPLLAAAGRAAEGRLAAAATRRARTGTIAGRHGRGRGDGPEPARGAAADPAAAGEHRGHVVISGWGEAARGLAAELRDRGTPLVVTTLNPDGAAEAERDGHTVVRGDPTKLPVLAHAGVPYARVVVVPEDDPETTARIASVVRGVSAAQVVVRPVGPADLEDLASAGAHKVIDPERSSARELRRAVVAEMGGSVSPAPGADGRTVVDTARLVHYRMPADVGCPHGSVIHPVLPSAPGCEECLRTGDTWVHLRVCLTCGHVGCCDSSPNRHARAHAEPGDHPLIASAEPGETWAYCFSDDTMVARPAPDPAARFPQHVPAGSTQEGP